MTRLKVFYDDQWQHLPARTRVEYTYEWEGEPHASPSVKRAGDGVVARNLGDNPTTSGTTGWRTNNTANWAIERVALDDHPEGLEQGYRSQAVLDGNHLDNVLSMYDIGGTRLPAEVTGHAYGVWVKVNVPSTTGSRYGSTPIAPDTWTYLTGFRDSYLTGMQIQVNDPDDIGAAEAFTTGANIATADTEGEALAQVESYYDGDTLSHLGWQNFTPRVTGGIKRIWRQPTPPPAGTHYAWLGEPHESESVMLDGDGEEVARNWVQNSDFTRGGEGWTTYVAQNAVFENGLAILTKHEDGANDGIYQGVRNRIPDLTDETPVTVSVRLRGKGQLSVRWGASAGRHLIPETPIDTGEFITVTGTNATPGNLNLIIYQQLPGQLEIDHVQAEVGEAASPPFTGSTESDRAHDLWYDGDGVPHVWVNGQGWVAS